MPSLKSRLARAAARVITSDPEATAMLAAAVKPPLMVLRQSGEQIADVLRYEVRADPGVTPEQVRQALVPARRTFVGRYPPGKPTFGVVADPPGLRHD